MISLEQVPYRFVIGALVKQQDSSEQNERSVQSKSPIAVPGYPKERKGSQNVDGTVHGIMITRSWTLPTHHTLDNILYGSTNICKHFTWCDPARI